MFMLRRAIISFRKEQNENKKIMKKYEDALTSLSFSQNIQMQCTWMYKTGKKNSFCSSKTSDCTYFDERIESVSG